MAKAPMRLRRAMAWFSPLILLSIALLPTPPARAQLMAEQMKTLTLPAPQRDWVYVLDLEWPSMMVGRVVVLDASSMRRLGLVSAGYLSNFEIAPDHKTLYTIDTFYSRGAHGDRTDAVTIYNASTLALEGEVLLPAKRLLMISKSRAAAITPDGRFLLISNMTPATSLSVVDLSARKFVGEIETPGCTLVLMGGNRHFASMCADGSLLMIDMNDNGQASGKKQGKPFFDAVHDPVFDQPVSNGKMTWFVSFAGKLYAADLSGAEPAVTSWDLLSAQDRAQHWRPGGWQMSALDAEHGLLYVLMHQGGDNTYKRKGSQVWVFDLAKRKRVARIRLKTPGYSIRVTGGDKSLLVSVNDDLGRLESYDASSGRLIGSSNDFQTPTLLYGP